MGNASAGSFRLQAEGTGSFRLQAEGTGSFHLQAEGAGSFRLKPEATSTPDVVRILLVDDDPQARALIEMALGEARFQPTLDVAGNVRTGLERIRQDEHDLYLIDQQLPDGTGVNLITEARARGARRIPSRS